MVGDNPNKSFGVIQVSLGLLKALVRLVKLLHGQIKLVSHKKGILVVATAVVVLLLLLHLNQLLPQLLYSGLAH